MTAEHEQNEGLREIAASLTQAAENLGASRELLANQQGELDRAFIPRAEFDSFVSRVIRRDNIKSGVLAVFMVLLLAIAAVNRDTLGIIRDVTSPERQAEGDATVGAFLCALAGDHHFLHDSAPPPFLAAAVPVFKDGKPTGEYETVRFPCPDPKGTL